MQTLLYARGLRSKKDAVAFRERARQAARLLRFEPTVVPVIAAAAFVIAYQALSELIRPRLVLGLEGGCLHIKAEGERRPGSIGQILNLVRRLPEQGMSPADLAFIVAQTTELRTTELFEELYQQNQEILALGHALQEQEREMSRLRAGN